MRTERSRDLRGLSFDAARFGLLVLALWFALDAAWRALPLIRAGHRQTVGIKLDMAARSQLFQSDAPVRLAVLGDSRVQTGFIPGLFDELSGGRVSSFNFGLPADEPYLDLGATLSRRGPQAPTHLLVTSPWPAGSAPSFWERLEHDAQIADQLFPFRRLGRDLLSFFDRASDHGGVVTYAKGLRGVRAQLRDERGYLVIGKGRPQSFHLPPDYREAGDLPGAVMEVDYPEQGDALSRLLQAARAAGMEVWIAPSYVREGRFGPPGRERLEGGLLAAAGIRRFGPAYWRYPNRLFSDGVHTSRVGARRYTTDLFGLLEPWIATEGPP